MSDDVLTKTMLSMGWNPDSDLPMANAENVLILKELEQLMEEKAQLEETLHDTDQRLDKLQQHAKNAEVSLNHNLKLLLAHQSEVQVELHLSKLVEREQSKRKEEIKIANKDLENYKQFVDTTENELCKRKNAIDDLTNRIKWAKSALVEWNTAMESGNKGYQLIEKYFKEDVQLANQKNARLQIVQNDIDKNRKELIQLYDEQKSLEQTIECTALLYRSAHAERRQMVDTWKTAVQQMLQRENDIEEAEERLIDFTYQAKQKALEQKSFDDKLNDIITNNREVEAAIEELNDGTSDIKEQIQKIMDMILLKENEVELVQKELQNIASRVQQQRTENRQNAKNRNEKLNYLNSFEEILRKLEVRLFAMENKATNLNERLQVLEEMNDAEVKAQNSISKETDRINGFIFRAQLQLSKLKDDGKILEVANDGMSVTIQAVILNSQKMEKELGRKTEMHYNLAFKCLQFERKIIKLQGGIIDPEEEQRNQETLANLENQNSHLLKRLQSTESQNKKLDDNMRKLTDVYNHDSEKLEVAYFKIKEAQVYCEGGVKRLKAEQHDNQVRIVELSILKMRANEFENEIALCNQSTYNLEKHRMHLIRTMNDRMVELKSQMDLLNLKRKHLCEEKSTLRADIGERNKHIEAVKARFELTSKLLGTNPDGSLVTATQLKVESAQEKQMLLDEGDMLNSKVMKAEEEIKAMENTLMLLNNSNDAYRKNLRKIDNEDATQNELKGLQINYCQALTRLKALRNHILKLDQENEKACSYRNELEKKANVLSKKREENNEILMKLQRELLNQKVKIQRAEREMKAALKTAKERAYSEDFLRLFDLELDLRELEYRNTSALNQLADMADNDNVHGPKIIRLMAEKGLKMPHLLQKARSFASWRSDTSFQSVISSKDMGASTSRSSVSVESSQTIRTSVVSIEFPS